MDPASDTTVGVNTAATVRFKNAVGRIKPVAPFLALWARFDDETELRPLTKAELGDVGLVPRAGVAVGRGRQPEDVPAHRRT